MFVINAMTLGWLVFNWHKIVKCSVCFELNLLFIEVNNEKMVSVPNVFEPM